MTIVCAMTFNLCTPVKLITLIHAAFWIATRGIKVLFDEEDNLIDPKFSTEKLRNVIYNYFDITDRWV